MKIKLPREISFLLKPILFSILLFIIDRIFKLISLNSGFPVINRGVAFGLFPGLSLVLTVIGFLLLSIIPSLRAKRGNHAEIASDALAMTPCGISLIIFGGFSNLLDRILYNGVVDYIRLGYIFPDFNLADGLIIAGSLMMGWQVLHSRRSGVGAASKPQLPF